MTVKASGRSALILATGLFVSFVGPLQAAAGEDETDNAVVSSQSAPGAPLALNRYTRLGSRHGRRSAHRKSTKMALKPSARGTPADVPESDNTSAIPPAVASANAQMTSAGNLMSSETNDAPQTAQHNSAEPQPESAIQLVSADQLNDVDRALKENKPVPASFAVAPTETRVRAEANESSAWNRTSMVGKIFIGLGALLTMATAMRMFIA
jgi:hypothetical protein